jgi:hypothetical protein
MPVFFSGDPRIDEALLATMLSRLGTVTDLVSNANVVSGWFARNRHVVPVRGGHTIVQPLFVQETGDIVWFTDLDPVNRDFRPGDTAAEFTWAWGAIPMTLEWTKRWTNTGPDQIMSLEERRFRQALITTYNRIAWFILNGVGGKEPLGLLNAIEDALPAAQTATVGRIAKATTPYWQNRCVQAGAGEAFGDNMGGNLVRGIFLMLQLLLQCRQGRLFPNAFFVNDAIHLNVLRAMATMFGYQAAGGIDPNVNAGIPHQVQLLGVPIIPEPDFPAECGLALTSVAQTVQLGNLKGGGTEDPNLSIEAGDLQGVYIGYHPEVDVAIDGPKRYSDVQFADLTHILLSNVMMYSNLGVQGRLGATGGGSLDTW